MKKLNLDRESIVYIYDKGSRSGGGEALFQLRIDLENLGYRCRTVCKNRAVYDTSLPKKFQKYIHSKEDRCLPEDIVDDSKNFLIVPETTTTFLFRYNNIQKVIWWLSSRYYDGKCRIENRPEMFRYQKWNIKDFVLQVMHISNQCAWWLKNYNICLCFYFFGQHDCQIVS